MEQHANRHESVYRKITEQISAAIAAGAPRYEMPWHQSGAARGRPVNALTKNPYQGVNVLALWVAAQSRGFATGTWGTYRQWRLLGAQVRKGEKGSTIVFYKKVEAAPPEEPADDDKPSSRLVARASVVFNADQVDDWVAPKPVEVRDPARVLDSVQRQGGFFVFGSYVHVPGGPTIRYSTGRAQSLLRCGTIVLHPYRTLRE